MIRMGRPEVVFEKYIFNIIRFQSLWFSRKKRSWPLEDIDFEGLVLCDLRSRERLLECIR